MNANYPEYEHTIVTLIKSNFQQKSHGLFVCYSFLAELLISFREGVSYVGPFGVYAFSRQQCFEFENGTMKC